MIASLNLLAALVLSLVFAQRPDQGDHVVEPADLTKDPNLIGRDVTVDDRIRYFQPKRGSKTQILEEFLLKRSDVVFRLPPGLRPQYPPKQPAVRAIGVLQKENGQYFVDVISYELMPSDTERFDREIKRLGPTDTAGRMAWVNWAERRAKDFKDNELAARARALETESILIDAERTNPDDLALANRARERQLGDDLVAALGHRAFQNRLRTSKSPADLAKLSRDVESLLPNALSPKPASGLDDWRTRMRTNPITVYRNASPETRAALDRALYVDVVQKQFETKLEASPDKALALADEATAKLPDHPEIARSLRDRGLNMTESKVTSMRLSDVEDLAKTFKDDGQPDRAKKVLKEWLDQERQKLHRSDAEGHILLADQYNRLIGDRGSAGSLLSAALKADPQAKGVTDAFRRLGFRKSADTNDWYDPTTIKTPSEPTETKPAPRETNRNEGSLRGLSPAQVQARLGAKPDRIVRVSTQDETIEQWIYAGTRGRTIVNFRLPKGRGMAEVVSNYSLP